MGTITKEQLRERARQKVKSLELAVTQTAFADSRAELEEELELARIALASLEAEPVAYIRDGFRADGVHFCGGIITAEEHERTKPALSDRYTWKHQPLYTAPPAPVAVMDEAQSRELFEKNCMANTERNKWHPELYAHIPAREQWAVWEACRAAMLQGAEQQQNEQQNIPENIPALREAVGTIRSSGISIDAEKIQAQRDSLNSPVIPEGWVACSERMPEDEQEVLTRNKIGHCFVSFFDEHSGLFFDRIDVAAACCIEHILVTHWMPLPAAPQQEVKPL